MTAADKHVLFSKCCATALKFEHTSMLEGRIPFIYASSKLAGTLAGTLAGMLAGSTICQLPGRTRQGS
jgi:hypothetical protein